MAERSKSNSPLRIVQILRRTKRPRHTHGRASITLAAALAVEGLRGTTGVSGWR